MTTTTPEVTPAAAWNGQHNQTVTLPSGNVAELRERFPVYVMLRTGILTGEMFTAFNQWQDGTLGDPKLASDLVDLMVCSMFINPKVTRDGADGTVAIEQISDEDIDFVLELASGGTPDRSFPSEPDGSDAGDDSADVEADPVKPARSASGKSRGAKPRQPARRKSASR